MTNSLGRSAPLLLAVLAAATYGCSKKEDASSAKTDWTCARVDVPAGESIGCVTSGMSLEPPPADTSDSSTVSGLPDLTISYDCPAGSTSADCPPSDPPIGSDGTSTTTSSSSSSSGADDTSNPPVGSNAGTGESSSSGSSGTTSGGSSDSSNPPSGTEECGYTDDLPYCAPPADSSTGSETSSSGSSGDSTECAKQNCKTPPGKDNSNNASSSSSSGASGSSGASSSSGSSGASSSSGSSGSGKDKGGHAWKCKKDDKGHKQCQSVPTCAPGTHPSACGACVSDDASNDDCVPPSEGGCWVTGGGFIQASSTTPAAPADGNDNFGGNAKPMKDGSINGHWNHVDHGTGNHALGRPEYIFCRHVDEPGPGQPGGKKGLTSNQVYFGGHARFRSNDVWQDGYWFDVVAKDHGEPGSQPKANKNGGMVDTYHFTLRKISDPANLASGTVVYATKLEEGGLVGGNIQIHPPNGGHPATQSVLPPWVALEP